MDTTSVFAPIFKSQELDDGTLMIYGKATGSDLDLDNQRCDPDWLKRAMPEWFKIGNIREQHDSKRAVGKATEHEIKDDGHYISAHIVDPLAVAKTRAGVFTGLSIGIAKPRLEKTTDGEWIRDGLISEISICDRPCLPTATFTMCKTAHVGWEGSPADLDEERGLVKCEELVEESTDEAEEAEKAAAPDKPCCDQCATVGDACCDMCPPAPKAAGSDAEKALNAAGVLGEAGSEFDLEAAKALVAEVLEKAGSDGLGQDESGDISGAAQAIAIIARLIQSEANDLAEMPSQGCDIELLMQAVHALRCFARREQMEQAGTDPDGMWLASTPELEKADNEPYGDVEYADPGYQKDKKKRYPVDTKEHAKAAWSYINKDSNASEYSSGDLAKVKARIKAACKKFGIDVSDKAIEPEVEKTIETEEAPVADIVETDDAEKTAEPVLEKTVEADAEKAVEPEVEKASTVEVDTEAVEKAVAEALAKAFSAEVLEKEDNSLRKTFNAIVEAATESIAKATADAVARLEKVEQMAVPGGPALRRTEIERAESRKNDLIVAMRHFQKLANTSDDEDLRKGYDIKARQLAAEIKAL